MELSQIQQYTDGRSVDTEPTTDSLRARYAALRALAADSEEAAAGNVSRFRPANRSFTPVNVAGPALRR